MRKVNILFFVVFFIVTQVNAQDWMPVGNAAGISAGETGRLTLVCDSLDKLVVGYYDAALSKGSVQKYDGAKWFYLGDEPGNTISYATYNSLTIDMKGVVYFTNQTVYPDKGLKLRKFESDCWEELPDATSKTINHQASSISNDGTLFIATGDNSGTVRKYVDGSWQQVGNAGIFGGVPFYLDMAITNSGIIYVSWNNNGNVHVYKNSVNATVSNLWEAVGNDPNIVPGTTTEFFNSSLAADSENNVYLAYVSDYANGRKLNVKKFDGATWSQLGSKNFSKKGVQHISIAVGANKLVYVAASEWDGDKVHRNFVLAYNEVSNSWKQAGIDWVSEGQAKYNSLIVDSKGNLFLAFSDAGLGKLSVKMLRLAPLPDSLKG
jgi:hypothetical protein